MKDRGLMNVVEQVQRSSNALFFHHTNVFEEGQLFQQVMIEMLSDDVLLNIFHHFLHASPQFWHTLTHVCQKWRQIIYESPLGLRLRLHCTYGTLS